MITTDRPPVHRGRSAIRDLAARDELRRSLAPAWVFVILAVVAFAVVGSIEAVAHMREHRFAAHATVMQATIVDGAYGPVAVLDRNKDPDVRVVINDTYEWSMPVEREVLVNDRNPDDVRIATETKAFLGVWYNVEELAVAAGVIALLTAIAWALFWNRRRLILERNTWRRVRLRAAGPYVWIAEPEGHVFRIRHLDLDDGDEVDIAGAVVPTGRDRSLVRVAGSATMRLVKGPSWPSSERLDS